VLRGLRRALQPGQAASGPRPSAARSRLGLWDEPRHEGPTPRRSGRTDP
jgi:hypothetical protein